MTNPTTFDGSKPIRDGRKECFATLLVSSYGTAKACHIEAGFTGDTANCSKLRSEPEMVARVDWLQLQAAKRAVVDKAWVLEKLRLNVIRTMTPGSEYQPSAANKAIELLGKEMGMFVDKRLVGVARIDDMTEDELLEFLGGEPTAEELRAAAGHHKTGHA